MKVKTKAKAIKHWSPSEELSYNFFLIIKADELLTNDTKAIGFYVSMSKYVSTRGKVQCRSHHQKMLLRFKKSGTLDKLEVELKNLNQFFQDNYALRMLDSNHLMKEIQHQLVHKLKKGIITKDLFENYKAKAEQNLEMLNFKEEAEESDNEEEDHMKEEGLLAGEEEMNLSEMMSPSLFFEPTPLTFEDVLFFSEDNL